MRRNLRVIITLLLCLFLSKIVNYWATELFSKAFDFNTQVYLRELMRLEEYQHCCILGSLVLSYFVLDRA